MNQKPLRLHKIWKVLGIVLLFLGLLAGAIHTYLYYRAESLFKAFVEQISNATYTASTEKLRFGYFPLRIKAVGARFYPLDTIGVNNLYEITCDTIQMRLTSLAPILLYNSLEVVEVRLVKPMVTLTSSGEKQQRGKARFHVPLKEIQDGLLKSLSLLQVDKCEVIDGGFALSRKDEDEKLAINHINLTIDNFLAARKGMLLDNGDTVNANLTLSLDKPNIVIPDSNFLVDVDRLFIDTKKNVFSIEELRFSRKKEKGTYDTLKLSSIELRGLNWDMFLQDGIIALDSVRAKNGLAHIDLTDRFIFRKRTGKNETEKLHVAVPLLLNHVNIAQVSYKLRSQRKTGPFTILLDGDSLQLRRFALLDTTKRAFNVESLSLNVRNYYDEDDKKTYLSSFDRLLVKNNDLEIRNYKLLPVRRKGFSANNRIEIPSTVLFNYDLEALLQGRLQADRLELNAPKILLDILRKKEQTGAADANNIFNVLNKLQPTLDIKELGINNATITLQPRTNLANSIKITQLSTELNVERLLSTNSIDDLLQVAEGIQSDRFYIEGPRFDLEVMNAEISKGTEQIKMSRLRGNISNTLEIDLDSVIIQARPGELIIPVDGNLQLASVVVGKGAVMFLRDAPQQKDSVAARKSAPNIAIDHLQTGDLEMTYFKNSGSLFAIQKVALDMKGLDVSGKNVNWLSLFMKGQTLVTTAGENNFRVGEWEGNVPGRLSFKNVKVWPTDQDVMGVNVDVPGMVVSNTVNTMKWDPESITDVRIINPQIRWNFLPRSKQSTDSVSTLPPPIFIKTITIIDPDISGQRLTKSGEKRFAEVENGRIELRDIDFYYTQPDRIAVAAFYATLNQPGIQLDSTWTLQPANLMMKLRDISLKNGSAPAAFVDSMVLDGIGNIPLLKDTNQLLGIAKAGIAGWQYPFSTDSLLQVFTKGPDWWVGGINYSLKGKDSDIHIYNAEANRKNRTIQFDSLAMVPHMTRDSFWKSNKYESDYFDLKLGRTTLSNVLPQSLKFDKLRMDKMETKDMRFLAARDKTMPDDTIAYRPLLAHQFMQMPYDIAIDTVTLDNAQVNYQEIGDKFGLEGMLFLDSLSGNMYGMNTRPVKDSDSILLLLTGKFMGTAPMTLQYRQPYLDTMQPFLFDLGLGRWQMSAINPLLSPLNSLAFRRGLADTMWLHATGNKDRAYGWMGFEYNKMNMGILKKGAESNYFMSGLVNTAVNVVLVNNNDGDETPFYVERAENKAVFNFWGKILSAGLRGNLGMPGKKKQARKAMRKEDLPAQSPGR